MQPDEKQLLEADNLLVGGKYEAATAALRKLSVITPEKPEYSTEDFNWQILLLVRLQRIYKITGNPVPAPLEKLIKYYEIVARKHPGENVELSEEEAGMCGLVLEWLPGVSSEGQVAAADAARGRQLVEDFLRLLKTNRHKYKLGVFYGKGF